MINHIKRMFQRISRKNTTDIQFESIRYFMRSLGYPKYQGGRFFGAGLAGCSVITYRTAIRLHNCNDWHVAESGDVYPVFNEHMTIKLSALSSAIDQKVVEKCKQQLVEKYGEPTIKTQSHIVRFKHRGFARSLGVM